MQEQRHLADYSFNQSFLRADVKLLIEKTRDAFAKWAKVREDKAAKLFLLLLLVSNRAKPR